MLDAAARQKMALDFLHARRPDHTGVFVNEYLTKDDAWLESCHGWIQWAFPINTNSPYNDQCGNLYQSEKVNRLYRYGSPLYAIQDKLLELYLNTIGLSRYNNPIETKFFQVIDSPHNHHMKRISRILKHLMLTNRSRTARNVHIDLLRMVMIDPQLFTQKTIAFWSAILLSYDDELRDKL